MIRLLGLWGLTGSLLLGCVTQQQKGVDLPTTQWTPDRVAKLVNPPPPEPVAVVEPEDPPPVPRRRPEQVASLPPSEPEPDEEAPDLDGLVGLDFDATEALLGEPALDEVQSPARVWAYAGRGCVLSIFFYPNVDGQSYRALTYEVKGAGDTPEQRRQCFAELVQERKGT